jgi:hypothetical protein
MAGMSASSLLLRVSATVRSLIPLRTLRAVDGAGSPCPFADARGGQVGVTDAELTFLRKNLPRVAPETDPQMLRHERDI